MSKQVSRVQFRANKNINAKKSRLTKREVALYLMIAPALLLYLVFHYIPLPGIAIAFADYRVGGFRGWVGWDNFRYAFNLTFFWKAFKNTWRFTILNYLFGFPAPIIFALLLNELRIRSFKKTVQTISTLPNFISWVVIGGMFISLLSPSTGYVNSVIRLFGGEPIYFLSKPRLFPWLFTLMRIWKGVGYGSIIYLAALAGV
ncbi:MAG: sugar ABC transporter permease, partial [Clostridiales bacterium]|nr:sugar ABC transporter permease [Clostridiales bacterium]